MPQGYHKEQAMQIHGMGLDLKGRRLFPGIDSEAFTTRLIDSLSLNGPRV